MYHLLRLISARRVRQHVGHVLHATAAVMVGVGAIVSVQLITAAISDGIIRGLDAFTGRTALRVEAGEAGLPESVLETVRAVPGVEVAVPILTSPAYVVGTPGEVLTVLGVDLTEESRVRRYRAEGSDETVVEDPLVFLSQANSLILTRAYADRYKLALDDRIELQTPRGKRTFVIRGLLTADGPAAAFGGNLAMMDYQAAQIAFSKERHVDEVDVVAAPGVDVGALARAIATAIGPGPRVEPPGARGAEIALAARSVTLVFWLFSALTVIVAIFLVHNVVAMTVAQRGEEIALLRVLGVRRRDSVRLILLEAAVIGVVGASAGVGFGVVLARVLLRSVHTTLGTALLVALDPSEPTALGPHAVATGVLVGLITVLLAAWLPARQATRFAPIVAARRGATVALRQGRLPSPWWGGAGLLLGGALALAAFVSGVSMLGPLADATLVVAFALLAPAVVRVALPVLGELLRPLGALGRLAVLNVARSPQRSALTTAPLMVAVALVVVVATMVQSFRLSFDQWIAGVAQDDLQVASVSQEPERSVPLDETLVAGVAALPGVARVVRYRMMHVSHEGRRIVVEYLDYDPDDPALGRIRFRQGDPRSAFAGLARGEAVVVSENFAINFAVAPGDVVRLNTPRGPRTLPIAAVARNYDGDQGAIMMTRSLFVSLFDDARAGFLLVSAQRGVDPETVRAAIMARYGEPYQLVIFTNAELRRDITARIDRAFLPASALLILALIVGCAGIASSQQVAITERVRELGILRSIGSRRRDVSRMIVLETAVLGLLGALLGIGLGVLLSYVWVVIHVRHFLGWMIDYHLAGRGALGALVAAVVTASVAGWFPARRAARRPPVLALVGE